MTAPFAPDEDEPIRARLRRAALAQYGFGQDDGADPVQQIGHAPPSPRMGSGLYRTSEIGNAEIDRSPQTAWKQTKTQAIIDAALAGLSGLDPKGGGLGGFIGSAAGAASRTRGVYDRLTQEEPSSATVPDQLLRYAFSEGKAPSEFDHFKADPTGYAAFKAAGRAAPVQSTSEHFEEFVGPKGAGKYRMVPGQPPEFLGKVIPKEAAAKPLDVKTQFGVAGGIEAVKDILAHYKADPTSIRTPVGAQWAESLAGIHVPGFGSPFEGLAESSRQHAMTPGQSEVADLYEALAHNTAGLLPNKGLAIFKSLRDVYRSKGGSSVETDPFKISLLERLLHRLEQIQRGEKVTDADFQSDIDEASHPGAGASPVPAIPRPANTTAPVQPTGAAPDPRKFFKPRSTP